MRSPAEAEQKQNLQRALAGLIPGLQDVEMVDGRQHDICDWLFHTKHKFDYLGYTNCGDRKSSIILTQPLYDPQVIAPL